MNKAATAEDKRKDKPTVGEELFLVHLKRLHREEAACGDVDVEDDHDHPQTTSQRKRSASTVGEELWQIHCKRSHCMSEEQVDEEVEVDSDEHHKQKKTVASISTKSSPTTTSKVGEEFKCTRYNLRRKDGSSAKKIL
jgi:hypothetical protein